MEKDYLSLVIEALIDKKIKHLKPEIRYSYKKEILDDMLVGASDTFNSVVLNTEYSLTYNPVNPDTIIVFSGTTYYQQYQDWSFSSGKIKFFGSIEAGSDITVSYKYYRAVGEMAASDILTKLLTVDGSGSGLDADLLDGKEGSYYTGYSDGKKILSQIVLTKKGDLEVGTDVSPMPFYVYAPCTIKEVYIAVRTAPTGSSIIVDVNKNGTTIFSTQANRPEIDTGEYVATSGAPDVTSLAKNDKLTIDVDQVGSTVAGADLIIFIRIEQVVS